MKLPPERIAAALKRDLHPIYLVSGDEVLLVQECCDAIRRALKEQDFTEKEVFHVDRSFNWEEVLFSANSLSLFGSRKLIELRMPTGKPGDKGAATLRRYAEDPPADTVLLIITDRLERSTKTTKWFKDLERVGAFIEIWPIEAHQLPAWLSTRIKQSGLQASRQVVQFIADQVEGNLLAAAQEIERLKLLSKTPEIDMATVMAAISDNSRYSVFRLIDVALWGDAERSCRILQSLQAEGVEILQLVALIARELRVLLTISHQVAAGRPLAAAMQEARIWQNRKKTVAKALSRCSQSDLEAMIRQLSRIDQSVKGLKDEVPWDSLTELVLTLAGTRTVGFAGQHT